jgi:DNA-binding transcriptional MerR regulator
MRGQVPQMDRSLAMTKSPQAFRTISEVATHLDVPAHVLRFWETKFTQVKPVKRGGGRRYYRPEDVSLLEGIRDLLYAEGMTIKGVQKILRERGARAVADHIGAVAPAAVPKAVAPAAVVPPEAARDAVRAAISKLEALLDRLRSDPSATPVKQTHGRVAGIIGRP